jgi:hypothetical protein
MFSQTLLSLNPDGLVVNQNVAIASSVDAFSPRSFSPRSFSLSSRAASSLAEASTTINGKTSSFRVDDNQIQVKADFNNDGISDLFQLDRRSGVAQLFVNQSTPIGTPIALPTVPPNWDFSGLADSDGNGIPDLYWTNKAAGLAGVWLSSGTLSPVFSYRVAPIGDASVTLPATRGRNQSLGLPDRFDPDFEF